MAILSGGPNSGFSGKAGSYVGYYRMGKWVIRGLPRLSPKNKKGSVKQNISRSRFTEIQHFLRPIIPVIRVGFNLEAKRKGNTAHNSAKSWNMLHAFDENEKLDYSKTRISSGLLTGAEDAVASYKDGDITFTWRDNSISTSSSTLVPRHTDQVMLLAYDSATQQTVYMPSGARRSACSEILKVSSEPHPRNLQWHTWIAFIADDRRSISNSKYLGLVNANEIQPATEKTLTKKPKQEPKS